MFGKVVKFVGMIKREFFEELVKRKVLRYYIEKEFEEDLVFVCGE